jgi:hypothetical protein
MLEPRFQPRQAESRNLARPSQIFEISGDFRGGIGVGDVEMRIAVSKPV